MSVKKKFKDLSLVYPSEQAYHDDPTISYSNISHYEREGFAGVKTLRDKKESPSLLLGSCVDTMLTDGLEEYNNRFLVAEFPKISDNLTTIVKKLYVDYGGTHNNLIDIPDEVVSFIAKQCDFWAGDKWDRVRAKKVKEEIGCQDYYRLMFLAQGKTVISTELHETVCKMVDALREHPSTTYYFQPDNPFENIERCYQPILKGEYKGIPIKIMADLIIIDHDKKTIQMTDLKTTKDVTTFEDSFYKWCYFYQAKMYTYVVKQVIEKDDYFKDFTILPTYKFIAIDKNLCEPVVFSYDDLFNNFERIVDCEHNIRESWTTLTEELNYYLNHPEDKLPIFMTEEIKSKKEVTIKRYFFNESN